MARKIDIFRGICLYDTNVIGFIEEPEDYTFEEKGKLFDAIIKYGFLEEKVILQDRGLRLMYDGICRNIDIDKANKVHISETNRRIARDREEKKRQERERQKARAEPNNAQAHAEVTSIADAIPVVLEDAGMTPEEIANNPNACPMPDDIREEMKRKLRNKE